MEDCIGNGFRKFRCVYGVGMRGGEFLFGFGLWCDVEIHVCIHTLPTTTTTHQKPSIHSGNLKYRKAEIHISPKRGFATQSQNAHRSHAIKFGSKLPRRPSSQLRRLRLACAAGQAETLSQAGCI